jgi:hypothetical protein
MLCKLASLLFNAAEAPLGCLWRGTGYLSSDESLNYKKVNRQGWNEQQRV